MAVDLTKPNGRVLGVDIIPAQPPKGVSTIQGNFLSPQIQSYVRDFLRNPNRGRACPPNIFAPNKDCREVKTDSVTELVDQERSAGPCIDSAVDGDIMLQDTSDAELEERNVDVVLSDMSAPWDQTTGFWKRSLSDPYHRMMNTSGMNFRDHAGSMVRSGK